MFVSFPYIGHIKYVIMLYYKRYNYDKLDKLFQPF